MLFRTDIECLRRELFGGMGGIPEPCAEGVLLRGSADDLEWCARELMRLPFRFEVRSPESLRRTLGRIASEIAREYSVAAASERL